MKKSLFISGGRRTFVLNRVSLLLAYMLITLFSVFNSSRLLAAQYEDDGIGSGSLTITVVDQGGEPVPEARVILYFAKTSEVVSRSTRTRPVFKERKITSDGGVVVFGDLEPGMYELVCTAPGYLSADGTDIVLNEGEEKQVRLSLNQGEQEISGRVVDEEGNPISGVIIMVIGEGMRMDTGVSSDETGYFRKSGLVEGYYKLWFSRKGFLSKKLQDILSGRGDLEVVLNKAVTISGRILTSDGSVPEERVKIAVNRAGVKRTRTANLGENGDYRIEWVEPGSVEVSVKTKTLISKSSVSLDITGGEEVKDVNFRLFPSASISGRVISGEDGIGLKDIYIHAKDFRKNKYSSAKTDEDGYYSISGLKGGTYEVGVESRSREKVTLKAGERKKNVNFEIEPKSTISIKGVVLKADGSPASGCRIDVIRFGKEDYPRSRGYTFKKASYSDHDGRFEFSIQRYPKYIVMAKGEGYAWSESPPLIPDEYSVRYEVTINLEEGMNIGGLVTDRHLQPITGAIISVFRGKRDFAKDRRWRPMDKAVTDENGEYRLESIHIGESTLIASGPGYSPESKNIDLAAWSPEFGYDFVLKPGGKIAGYVKDEIGNPIFKAKIRCRPQSAPSYSAMRARTSTDTSGHFEFINLAAGSYLLQVNYPGFPGLKEEEVFPSGKMITIILKKGIQLEGRVRAAGTKTPIDDFQVELKRKGEYGEWETQWGLRDRLIYEPGGSFVIKNVPPGTYRVMIIADGYQTAREGPIVISSAEKIVSRDIYLEKGYSVSGIVRSVQTDKTVERATVYVIDPGKPLDDLDGRISGTDWTDSKGAFEISGIEAGEYTLLVSGGREYSHYQSEKFMMGNGSAGQVMDIYLEEAEEMIASDEFRFKFLGFSVAPNDEEELLVKNIFPQSPAERAGLKVGDQVVSVAGKKCENPWDIVLRLRAPVGEKIAIEVRRIGVKEPLVIEVEKGKDYDPLLW